MPVVMSEPSIARKPTRTRPAQGLVTTVIHIVRDKVFLGRILLGKGERTLRCDPAVPRDVILKILALFTKRDEVFGAIQGRDGSRYGWHVVGWDEF
jgi:hypothetical protein